MFSYNPRHKSLDDIKRYVTELDLLQNYFPDIKYLPVTINSPLRKDIHPSFSIFSREDKILYKDFSTGESGDIYTLLSKVWGLSFTETIDKIYKEFNIEKSLINTTRTNNKRIHIKSDSKLLCKIRDWKNYDIEYWESYGVTLQWLKWAEVYPISHIIIDKDNHRYVFKAEKLAYCYVHRKDGIVQLKIYNPLSTNGRKWYSNLDKSVWSLWDKIPITGNNLIISSSLKDCLNISANLNIPAICLQGENYIPKPHVVKQLQDRYKNIIIFYDNDYRSSVNYGRKDALMLHRQYGFPIIEIPAYFEAKDPSDLYKKYGKESYLNIMKYILNRVLWKKNGKI